MAALIFCVAPAHAGEPVVAQRIDGGAYASREGSGVWRSLPEGRSIAAGETVRVFGSSRVQARLGRDVANSFMVQGDFEVARGTNDTVQITLHRGRMMAALDRLGPSREFKVVTPAAVATVRGTRYWIQCDGVSAQVGVLSGSVWIRSPEDREALSRKRSVLLEEGFRVRFCDEGADSEPVRISPEEKKLWEAELRRLSGMREAFAAPGFVDDLPAGEAGPVLVARDETIESRRRVDMASSAHGQVVF